jgi:hypothetical protein
VHFPGSGVNDGDVEQVAVLCSDLDFARKMRRRSAIVIRGREEGFVMIQVCFSANHTPKADASYMATGYRLVLQRRWKQWE